MVKNIWNQFLLPGTHETSSMIPPSSQKPHGVLKTVLKTVQDELKKQVGYKVRMSLSRAQGGSWHCKGVKPCVVYAETLARHKILWKDKSWYRQLIFLEYNISNIFHSMFHVQICPSQEASLPKKHIVWHMMVSVSDGSTCSVISLLVSGVSSINGIIPVEFSMEPEKNHPKRRCLLETIINRFHVKFRGCASSIF